MWCDIKNGNFPRVYWLFLNLGGAGGGAGGGGWVRI